MTGPALAAAAGVGFGVFQTLNRRAVVDMDAYVSTFLQLLTAAAVVGAASVATENLSALEQAGAAGIGWFALAGIVHFFGGWTFLNLSQKRIGAARTSPLLATVPLFGVLLAAATLGELPGAVSVIGIAVMLSGVYLVVVERLHETGGPPPLRDAVFGLATASCWAVSPVFIKLGLRTLHSPLLGLTIGMFCAVAAYAVAIPVSGRPFRVARVGISLELKLLAGVFVGLSVWARWFSLDTTSVGVVLALGLLSIPVVLALSPLILGRELERITRRVVAGAALVVGGSLLLVIGS